jgi:molybdopterin-guanine dinucleotide biosynthesis protein A
MSLVSDCLGRPRPGFPASPDDRLHRVSRQPPDVAPHTAIGVVLAGGRSSRIGGAKALADLAGQPLISYPLAALDAAGLDPVVVAKGSSPLPELTCTVIREPPRPSHPLCGVIAALRWGGGRPVVVVGCDMPFVTAPLLAWLASLDGLVVPEVDDRLQPLLARYEAAYAGALENALRGRHSMREAVAALEPRILDERELRRFGDPGRLFFNVNDTAGLHRAERLLAQG